MFDEGKALSVRLSLEVRFNSIEIASANKIKINNSFEVLINCRWRHSSGANSTGLQYMILWEMKLQKRTENRGLLWVSFAGCHSTQGILCKFYVI